MLVVYMSVTCHRLDDHMMFYIKPRVPVGSADSSRNVSAHTVRKMLKMPLDGGFVHANIYNCGLY